MSVRAMDPAHWREDLTLPPALGCPQCPDFGRCGGLRIEAAAMDCTAFCDCETPESCDRACRKNPHFVERCLEVDSLDLLALPSSGSTTVPLLYGHAPLVYHGSSRQSPCTSAIVAVPLFALFRRTGEPKFSTRNALLEHFKVSSDACIVASGTDRDGPLERWWEMSHELKQRIFDNLRTLEIALITSPNYSVFNNVPYWDNEHNQKRGALSWTEFMAAGVPAALHLNCHRDYDYRRYGMLLRGRPDIQVISVEFGTGMGHPSRVNFHLEQLSKLARELGRPIGIVVRGGLALLPAIASAYSSVLFVDTEPFVKTLRRQRGVLDNDVRVQWRSEPTEESAFLDVRLREAIDSCAANFHHIVLNGSGSGPARYSLRETSRRDDKTRDVQRITQFSLFPLTINDQNRIAGSKSNGRVQTIETDVELTEATSMTTTSTVAR
jgi:hypothetical protein